MREFEPPRRFESHGIVLRPWGMHDAEAMSQAVEQSYEHLRPFLPWATASQPPEDCRELIRTFSKSYETQTDFVISIWDAQSNELLGGTGFHLRIGTLKLAQAEIGMWIRQSCAACGVGTRALLAMTEWGFDAWPWLRLEWHCDAANRASCRVAKKAGYKLEARLRKNRINRAGERSDTLIFGRLKSDTV